MTLWFPADQADDMAGLVVAARRFGIAISQLSRHVHEANLALLDSWEGPAAREARYRYHVPDHYLLLAGQAFTPEESSHHVVWVLRQYAELLADIWGVVAHQRSAASSPAAEDQLRPENERARLDFVARLTPLAEQLDRIRRNDFFEPNPFEPAPPGTGFSVDVPGIRKAARGAEDVAGLLDRTVIPQNIGGRAGPAEPALHDGYAWIAATAQSYVEHAARGFHDFAAATQLSADGYEGAVPGGN